MKKRYILLLLFCLVLVGASAQTLEQAKAFYNKGQYEKAKPVFKKFVRTQPANGNYNLWYGVCCLETGEPDVALKYLETAVKKRIPSGQLYLARTCIVLKMPSSVTKSISVIFPNEKGLPQKLKNFWKRARPISAC